MIDIVQERIYKTLKYIPWPTQQEGHESNARFKALFGGCFDDDTEILTFNGWKFFKDITEDELVLTINLKDGNKYFQKITKKIEYFHEGLMYRLKGRDYDFLITPDHRLLLRGKKKYFFKAVKDIKRRGRWIDFNIGRWNNKDPEFIKICDKQITLNSWVKFMGLFLSEGHTAGCSGGISSQANGNYIVAIHQVIHKDEVRNVLKELPYHFLEQKDRFIIRNKDLWQLLLPLGNKYQKYIPQHLKQLSHEKLQILWDYLVLGDGTITNRKTKYKRNMGNYEGKEVYYTSSKTLANDVQDILTRMGYKSHLSFRNHNISKIKGRSINSNICYEISRKSSTSFKLKKKNIIEEFYSGNVYCVEVSDSIIYVRKNGYVFLTGNSRYGKSMWGAKEALPDIIKSNTRGWIVGPKYEQPSKEFKYIYDDLVINLGFKPQREINARYTTPGPQILIFPWGSEVHTKSEENPESLLGEEIDWLILSEAARIKETTYDRYLRARLGTRLGRVIIPTTPHGYNWVYKRFYLPAMEGNKDYWAKIVSVLENTKFSLDEYKNARKELPEEIFREQYDGEFVAYTGLIYKRFSRQLHVIPPMRIPSNWVRYCIIDPHPSTPTAVLWIAIDEYDTLYLYDEMFIPDLTIPEICERIRTKEGRDVIYKRLIDPNAKYIDKLRGQTVSVQMQFRREDINCIEANNKFESAYYKISELLTPQPAYGDKTKMIPRLFVFNTLKQTIMEFETYTWEDEKDGRCHMMDTLKYFINDNPISTFKEQDLQDIKREEEETIKSMNMVTGY